MGQKHDPRSSPINDAATHPEAGSGLRDPEARSFAVQDPAPRYRDEDERSEAALARGGPERDKELEGELGAPAAPVDPDEIDIAADDAGATAMAEAAGRQQIPEQEQ